MVEPTPSEIRDDLVATLNDALPELLGRITPEPPEGIPQGLCIWLQYGPVEIEWGLMEVSTHTITAVVAVPRKSNYPGEYRIVTDYAHAVHVASYTNYVLADEALIVGVLVNGATGAAYAGQPDVLVAATVVFTVETKNDRRSTAQE